MNERIKQLAEQAGMVMYPTGLGISENTLWGDKNIAKFAELIVHECLAQNKLAIQSLKDNPEDTPGYKTILNLAQVTCWNQIKEHFGVEE